MPSLQHAEVAGSCRSWPWPSCSFAKVTELRTTLGVSEICHLQILVCFLFVVCPWMIAIASLGYACRPDWQLLAAGAVVFGLQRLVPAYEDSYKNWYPKLRKPRYHALRQQTLS